MEYMESKGLKPLPTFHYRSPLEELERLVEQYDYIALGGLVPLALKIDIMRSWLDKCFYIIRDRVKIHGFGVNAMWAWKRYPFYSVDATSWLSAAKYRQMTIQGEQINKSHKSILGLKMHTADHVEISKINMLEYVRQSKYVVKLWNKRGLIWE